MKRSKKILLVHNCLLNANVKAKEIARYASAAPAVIKLAAKHKLGLVQLPCPEEICCGLDRPPKSRDFYNNPAFRKLCRKIAKETIGIIKKYKNKGYRIYGIVGVGSSPSCGIKGILVEEIKKTLKKSHFRVPYLIYANREDKIYH